MMFRENFSICNFDTFMLPGPPEAPTISGLPSISLREGDNLVLTCISRHGSPLPTLKWFRYSPSCYCNYSLSILFLLTRQGEYIENQNFTRQDSDQSVAKLFLVVSRADNHVQYSCEASNGDHFPSVSQKTNFSVNARRIRRGTHCMTIKYGTLNSYVCVEQIIPQHSPCLWNFEFHSE